MRAVGWVGVVTSAPNGGKLQPGMKPIAHEVDVALNRPAHHFEFAGQVPGVGPLLSGALPSRLPGSVRGPAGWICASVSFSVQFCRAEI